MPDSLVLISLSASSAFVFNICPMFPVNIRNDYSDGPAILGEHSCSANGECFLLTTTLWGYGIRLRGRKKLARKLSHMDGIVHEPEPPGRPEIPEIPGQRR